MAEGGSGGVEEQIKNTFTKPGPGFIGIELIIVLATIGLLWIYVHYFRKLDKLYNRKLKKVVEQQEVKRDLMMGIQVTEVHPDALPRPVGNAVYHKPMTKLPESVIAASSAMGHQKGKKNATKTRIRTDSFTYVPKGQKNH